MIKFSKSVSSDTDKKTHSTQHTYVQRPALFMKKDIWMQSKQFAGLVSGNIAIYARTTREI